MQSKINPKKIKSETENKSNLENLEFNVDKIIQKLIQERE